MRTVDEMIRAAMLLRNRMLQEQKDPTTGVFHVTQEERMALRDQPPFNHVMLSPDRERLCGLELKSIS